MVDGITLFREVRSVPSAVANPPGLEIAGKTNSPRLFRQWVEQVEPMIAAQDILGYLKAQPFRPIRIHMPSGRTFDVWHPEMVRVGRTHLLLFSVVSDNPDIHDRWEMVGLMLIESISFLDAPVA